MRKHGFDTDGAVRVGSGASADVYRVRHENGKEYAIKTFDTMELNAANCGSLLNEARLLAALSHPHIVAYKDTFLTRDRQFVCMAMELLTGGTLARLIKQQAAMKQYLPEPLVWRYFLQLATAVAHMHAAGVVHRDLKPSNCVFSDTTRSQLKLLDLGLARRLVPADYTLSQAGTPAYAAPEVYNRQPMSFPVDVWSLGCILHQLCALQPAFDGESVHQLRGQVLLGATTPLPRLYSSELRQLVAAMVQQDPAQRITMPQLLAHPAVAPRLAQLQAQGLVGVAAAQSSGSQQEPAPTAPCRQATPGASRVSPPGTLERLLELMPPPRHSSAEEEVSSGGLHAPDVQLSAWYASGPAAALPAAQQPEQRPLSSQALASQQAAVLGALHLPSGLTDNPKKQPAGASGQPTIVIHVDAFSSGSNGSSPFGNRRGNGSGKGSSAVPSPAVQPAPLPAAHPSAGESDCKRQRSRSLPDHMTAEPVQPQLPAVLAQLHPKFRKMAEEALKLEAAGTCRPRPTCTQRASPSPPEAPGSPQPAGGRPRSTAGAAGTPRTRPPAPRRSLFDARALEARIEEVKRCGGGAAAVAAAVRATLAEDEAALLRAITERVYSVMSTPRATPRARAAAAASVEGSVAGSLADRLSMGRSLPGCSVQQGALGHSSPLGRPSAPQQLEPAAAVREPVSMEPALQQSQPQPQQCSVMEPEQHSVEEPEPRKLRRRWGFRSLLFRRRTAQ